MGAGQTAEEEEEEEEEEELVRKAVIPHRANRAVLFNAAFYHESDSYDFSFPSP